MSAANGGPAFPHPVPVGAWGDPEQGMSLRDYFAAKALPALLVTPFTWGELGYVPKSGRSNAQHYAAHAYELADAMLAERAK